jgi:hypothetical protein
VGQSARAAAAGMAGRSVQFDSAQFAARWQLATPSTGCVPVRTAPYQLTARWWTGTGPSRSGSQSNLPLGFRSHCWQNVRLTDWLPEGPAREPESDGLGGYWHCQCSWQRPAGCASASPAPRTLEAHTAYSRAVHRLRRRLGLRVTPGAWQSRARLPAAPCSARLRATASPAPAASQGHE